MTEASGAKAPPAWEARIVLATVVIFGVALAAVLGFSLRGSDAAPPGSATTLHGTGVHVVFPPGIKDALEPSGLAVPPRSVPGFVRSYASDFLGTTVPAGWYVFTGVPGGDPDGQFATNHVTVSGGLLRLNTWRDPAYGMKWVTGGLCHCTHPQTFGAFFVRSRVTGSGPNVSELLWPADNSWPPEIDFNETGSRAISTSWTVHFGVNDSIRQQTLRQDMTKWHTWGVLWTPNAITFLVDGKQWGVFPFNEDVPRIPMTLDLQQRTGCTSGFVCPKHPQSLLIDWVAEYTRG